MASRTARKTPILIVGAGPFGLSLAAHLRYVGRDFVLAGRPMSFWREHMPRGMLLRSGLDWHLDAEDEATLKAFVAKLGLSEAEALPLSRDRYLSYVAWFAREKELAPSVEYIDALIRGPDGGFVAETSSGQIEAQAVVVATGFREHAHVPPDVAALLPDGSYGHTCEYVDFAPFAGRSVVIVGGRQSAFESAALLAEAGAKAVHVVHRHNTPDFTASDWSWVEGLMRRMEEEPGWYGALSEVERIELDTRFWVEGRRKLEPWLASRLAVPSVRLWPNSRIHAATPESEGLDVELAGGEHLQADFVLLATGYQYNVANLLFLSPELLGQIQTRNGFPVLDSTLQSSVDGLYFTSMAATQAFGSFFAFTVSARCSSRLIGQSLLTTVRDN